jgi:RimJ/RimL family protein N-acetyltransferase
MKPITVRPLARGEDDLWRACRSSSARGPSGARALAPFTAAPDFRPEAYLVAERGDRIVGKLEMLISEPHEVVLDSPVVVPGEDVSAVVGALLARGLETANRLGLERVWVILHTRLPYLDELLPAMPGLGFLFRWKKCVFSLDPRELPALPPGPPILGLAYRSMSGPEDKDAREIVARVLRAPVNFDDRRGDHRDLLAETAVETRANGTYRPERWEIALESGRSVGFVFPGWVDARVGAAGNLYVGVAPEARGRGVGLHLQHRGLSTMKREGAKRFVSSTDYENVAMRRILVKLGFRETGVQHYFEPARA